MTLVDEQQQQQLLQHFSDKLVTMRKPAVQRPTVLPHNILAAKLSSVAKGQR